MVRRTPYVVALVELEEGIRLVSNLVGVAPDGVTIGMPVEVRFEEFDDGLVLPAVPPDGSVVTARAVDFDGRSQVGDELPALVIDVTADA